MRSAQVGTFFFLNQGITSQPPLNKSKANDLCGTHRHSHKGIYHYYYYYYYYYNIFIYSWIIEIKIKVDNNM